MAHVSINTASVAQLNAGIDAVITTVVLSGPTFNGWPITYPYWGIIARGTSVAEIVEVTSGSGSTLTVIRGRDGTLASPHNTGDTFEHIIPADTANRAEQHIDATAAHGATGAVVGTTNAQTLTQKLYQGGHKHVFTDTNPAALTAGYESVADSAAAKDGFVHNNSAGDNNRRGFLLAQSGTPRFEAFNDGTVFVTPNGTATRKGIETTTSIKAGTTLESVGNTTVGGTLGVTGAATLSNTLGVSGATTLSTTLGVTGNTTVGGTLGITGTTTAATVNASALNASGAVSGATVASTGALTSFGGRVALTVSSLASITTPVAGDLALLTTDLMLYRYTGSAWLAVLHTGQGGGFATYNQIAAQTTLAVTATWTKAAFPNAAFTHADITATNSTDYVVNRAGTWLITARNRIAVTNVAGVRFLYGVFTTANAPTGASPIAVRTFIETDAVNNSTNVEVSTGPIRLGAGTSISVALRKDGTAVGGVASAGGGSNSGSEVTGGFTDQNSLIFQWWGP